MEAMKEMLFIDLTQLLSSFGQRRANVYSWHTSPKRRG
uniref:Uncharacterized protein n=1 Tax=Picea glauca TaxID=3330 RepID=A0A101M2A3_PICGL|nr:hypothetical protein ABT39_MTgene2986 [Picea glauca]